MSFVLFFCVFPLCFLSASVPKCQLSFLCEEFQVPMAKHSLFLSLATSAAQLKPQTGGVMQILSNHHDLVD